MAWRLDIYAWLNWFTHKFPRSQHIEDQSSTEILRLDELSRTSLFDFDSCPFVQPTWIKMSSKRIPKKDLPDDEALDEVNKHIKDAFDILKRETNKLRKERNAFDEVAKKLEHVHFSTMLKLNVGGHFFSTSLATMTKDPGTLKQVLNFELRTEI